MKSQFETEYQALHAAAVFEESALLAQLNDRPESKPTALSASEIKRLTAWAP